MTETFCAHCGGLHEPSADPCREPPVVGRTLPDGLKVLKALRRINVGVVYRGKYRGSKDEIEVVFLLPERASQLGDKCFRAATINHPNVATVRGVGETEQGIRYVAFEVLGGELLSEILAARRVLPLLEALDLILQAAEGLQAAHEAGLPHGNLSPDAILITRTLNDRPLVKLIRFGVMQHSADPLEDGDGSGGYAAPERLAGHPPDEQSDVYSLGAVLHHLLYGGPPGAGRSLGETVPNWVRAVISKALEQLPEHRFPTAAAFAEALTGTSQKPRAWGRGMARGARVAAAAGVLLILVAAGLWLRRTPERSRTDGTPVEAATRRDTGAGVEVRESAATPSAPADTAPAPPPLEPRHRGVPRKAKPSPTAILAPVPESTVADLGERATAKPAQPESLAVDTTTIALPPPAAVPLPAPRESVTPRPAGRRTTEAEARAAVTRTVASYARAVESNDLQALQWVYPDITDREREAWKKFFSVARDLVVTLNIERYAISDSDARLDVRGTYQYWNRSLHRSELAPVNFLATLKRSGDGWRLTSIR
jgi:serine/threonine protein kinase